MTAVALSLGTAGALLVHDTNVDKAAVVAVTRGTDAKSPGNDPHTHGERGSLYQAVRDLRNGQHRTQPRVHVGRKDTLEKPLGGGHHAFDNSHLPIVS